MDLVGEDLNLDFAPPSKGRKMAKITQKITTFLWFDDQAEEAMKFYVSVFPDSKVLSISHYNSAVPGKKGSVMVCKFQLADQEFLALNGGPNAEFNESVSLFVQCETQTEIDDLWSKLSEGGSERPCGWLTDKFGLCWQTAPSRLLELVQDRDDAKASRAMQAMFGMKKIIIADLERAVLD
jgi:predicted 3-demethylubiquinone-9 3-methyltransferase (glyoxalase superfamily)